MSIKNPRFYVSSRIAGLIATTLLITSSAICVTPPSKSRANTRILYGAITSIKTDRLSLRSNTGDAFTVQLDDQTKLLRDDIEFSVASMGALALPVCSLKIGDRLEVIAELSQKQYLGRIITLISPATVRTPSMTALRLSHSG